MLRNIRCGDGRVRETPSDAAMRTTTRTIKFGHPFVLAGVEGVQPPGSYAVEIDEELLPGLSFPAYRRVETRISLPWRTMGASGHQTICVKSDDLEAALASDSAAKLET